MRKIAYIGLATLTLAATALPALADDQSISFATGMIGGTPQARWNGTVQRTTPSPYDSYAQSSGYTHRSCRYKGGPKGEWQC